MSTDNLLSLFTVDYKLKLANKWKKKMEIKDLYVDTAGYSRKHFNVLGICFATFRPLDLVIVHC